MPPTFYNIKRLHVVFAASSLALLAATVWMAAADFDRPWKRYQRTYHERFAPNRGDADATAWSPAVDQISLSELTIDYHFRRVGRVDRCRTCHAGIGEEGVRDSGLGTREEGSGFRVQGSGSRGQVTGDRGQGNEEVKMQNAKCKSQNAEAETLGMRSAFSTLSPEPRAPSPEPRVPHPYAPHPRLDLFVGESSPHPASEFGCTICHEGQGSATEFTYASHSPNCLDDQARWQEEYGWSRDEFWDHPMLPARFAESRCVKCHHDVTDLEPSRQFPDPPAAKLVEGYHLVRTYGCFGCHEIRGATDAGQSVGPDLRLEPQGTLRKVAPTLRHTAEKLDAATLDAWIANPASIRPETRMPRLYGLHDHLSDESIAQARRFEAVEIRGIREYLLAVSEGGDWEFGTGDWKSNQARRLQPAGSEVERGKKLFQTRGCLACHRHEDFPEAQSTFGPDLTHLASKLATAKGEAWLEAWIRDPHSYSFQTLMPRIELPNPEPQSPIPSRSIAAYLLSSGGTKADQSPSLVESDVDALALSYLSGTVDRATAAKYFARGIPGSLAAGLPAEEQELVGPITLEKKLRYVGRRTVRRRGCFGCHDVPGFDDAQPIGPALSDWGKKPESQLAFEQVAKESRAPNPESRAPFFAQALRERRREGFVWQKLGRPRSFDYKVAEQRDYKAWLTMGQFGFSDDQREAIATFVLGLVADPPVAKYVYHPDRRGRAVVEGRKVLDKYGCAECHVLGLERWRFAVAPDEFEPPPAVADFAFLQPHFGQGDVIASKAVDRRGLVHAELFGMPRLDADGRAIEEVDDDDNPLYFFTPWEPALVAGHVVAPGGADVMISRPQITRVYPAWGGALARLLFPVALEAARADGATTADMEPLGWLPPALVHEGQAVRPEWLHEYLLNPTSIRPAALLRMPRFNLSPEEAATLVEYFRIPSPEPRVPNPDSQAMQLLTDRTTFCAKCHLIGDYSPGETVGWSLAPQLDRVGRRIHPEYLRRWLANPKTLRPYTAMPVNFPPTGPPLGQDLLPGTSLEQIDAMTQMLRHYDDYMKSRISIRAMIESAPKPQPSIQRRRDGND